MLSGDIENLGLSPYNFEPEFTEKEIEEVRRCPNAVTEEEICSLRTGVFVTSVTVEQCVCCGSGKTKNFSNISVFHL